MKRRRTRLLLLISCLYCIFSGGLRTAPSICPQTSTATSRRKLIMTSIPSTSTSTSSILSSSRPPLTSSAPSSSSSSSSASSSSSSSSSLLEDIVLIEHDRMGTTKSVRWDDSKNGFRPHSVQEFERPKPIFNFLKHCFIPSGAISSDYYKYSLWRMAQRFVSATSSVFGTQALLLALGFKTKHIGVSAATMWVLKDALGKVSRIFWASKHGRKFDSDAKKWRFRSSIIFAVGNGLEILTYIVPSLFLLTAALANAMKQMAMLTSSATRNTIYKSFARNSDNIGDITAKGEAQIAVIDLLGMATGIFLSRNIGATRWKISLMFLILSTIDLTCIFNEIKSVVFTTLNFERTGIVLRDLFATAEGRPLAEVAAELTGEPFVVEDEPVYEVWSSTSLLSPVIQSPDSSSLSLSNSSGSAESSKHNTTATLLEAMSPEAVVQVAEAGDKVQREPRKEMSLFRRAWRSFMAKIRRSPQLQPSSLSHSPTSPSPTESSVDRHSSSDDNNNNNNNNSSSSSDHFAINEIVFSISSGSCINSSGEHEHVLGHVASVSSRGSEQESLPPSDMPTAPLDEVGPEAEDEASSRPVATGSHPRGSEALALALTPADVASREPILLPTRFGEEMFRSWTTLNVAPQVLRGCLELFGGRSTGTRPKAKSGEKFVVTLGVRVAESWMDAKLVELSLATGGVLRSVAVPLSASARSTGVSGETEQLPVILSPQVLLHKDATTTDVFRAVVIVEKLLEKFCAQTQKADANMVGVRLRQLAIDSENENARALLDEALLSAAGLHADGLVAMVKDARDYEKANFGALVAMLEASGWDTTKFTFGNLKTRVEYSFVEAT